MTRRIEITNVDFEKKVVQIDFQFGGVLVNFDFKLSDLEMLKKLIPQLEAEFTALNEIEEPQQP